MASGTRHKLRMNGNCSICLSAKTKDIGAISCCKHTFHLHCIKQWSKITNKCPFCKLPFSYITSLDTSKVIKVEDKEQRQTDNLSTDLIESTLIGDLAETEQAWDDKPCSMCHEHGNDEYALICDGCENIFHSFCVGLGYQVPSDPVWFCSDCSHLYVDEPNEETEKVEDEKPKIIYKDDLSDYDSNEELPLNTFTKPSKEDEEEWVPSGWKAENPKQEESDFGVIRKEKAKKKSKKKKKKKKKRKKHKKRILIEEEMETADEIEVNSNCNSLGNAITNYQNTNNRKRSRKELEVKTKSDELTSSRKKRRKLSKSEETKVDIISDNRQLFESKMMNEDDDYKDGYEHAPYTAAANLICPHSDCSDKGIFTFYNDFENHMEIFHNDTKPYKCTQCDKGFSKKSSLCKHAQSAHEKKVNFTCNECGKGFYFKIDWERHVQTHSNQKPFNCNHCDLSFGTQRKLRYHIERVHEKKINYVCDVCQKGFYLKPQWENHCRIHTGQRPFQCNQCSKAFKQKSNLNKHIRSVHEKKVRFKCDKCQKGFYQKSNWNKHIQSKYRCDL